MAANYEPTAWKNRRVKRPRTYTVVNNEDGSITLIPAPGEIQEAGTPLNEDNLNHMEQGIADCATGLIEMQQSMGGHENRILANESGIRSLAQQDKALDEKLEFINESLAKAIESAMNGHSHGNITSDGRIGEAAGYFIATSEGGLVEAITINSARVYLGLGDWNVTGCIPVFSGGTGKKILSPGCFLVGNGEDAMLEKTPAEVRALIGAQSAILAMTEDPGAGASVSYPDGTVIVVYE